MTSKFHCVPIKFECDDRARIREIPVPVEISLRQISRGEDAVLVVVVAMVHRVLDFGAGVGVFAVGGELAFPERRVGRAAMGGFSAFCVQFFVFSFQRVTIAACRLPNVRKRKTERRKPFP